MKQTYLVVLYLLISKLSFSQSLISTLHLNEEREYRFGIPLKITEYKVFYNRNNTEKKKEIKIFDASGLQISEERYEDDKLISITNFKVDTIRRIILESSLNEINTRFKTNRVKTIYTYNEGASPVKIEYFNKNGVLISEATLKNNADGLPIELHNFEPIGTLIGSESANYILNENKAIVSIKSPEGENLFTDTVSINFKNASKFNNPNFKFNEFGDLVFSTTKWFNGSVHFNEYEYKYDEIGNWIDKKCYEVTFNADGKKKRRLKSHFSRQFIY